MKSESTGYSREKAVKTARAILDGEIGIIEGARILSTLAPDVVADWKADPDFLVLAALDSETDDLPVGVDRKLWEASALAERDAIVSQIEADAKQSVEAACRNILRRFVAGALFLVSMVAGAFIAVGCHKGAAARRTDDVGPVIKDTVRVVAQSIETSIINFFKDTAVVSVFSAQGQTFALKTPAQRQSFRAAIRKERRLWQARKPRDYRFLLRVGCFCPGTRGWLLIEVRNSQLLRAWERSGQPAAIIDWNTFSIDGLYDNLERAADINGEAQIAFDPRWHFPKYVRTVAIPGPDAWSIIEVSTVRPI